MLSWLAIALSGAVAFFVILKLAYEIYYGHVLRMCRSIPSAQPCHPLLGIIPSFACSVDKLTENVFKIMRDAVAGGHRAVCLWCGAYPVVVIVNPDDIKKVLNNSVSRGKEGEECGKYYTKYGLITAAVDHWKVTRRQLNLTFHPNSLRHFVPVFNSTGARLAEDLAGHAGGAAFDLMPHVVTAALKNTCVLQYGPRVVERVGGEHFDELRRVLEVAVDLFARRGFLPLLQNDFVFKMMYSKEIELVKNTFNVILQKANNPIQSEEDVKDDFGQSGDCGFKTVLSAMNELKEKFPYITDQHVTDEMTSFFMAGPTTMGDSVSSCLLALASDPRVQDAVYEEIRSAVSDEQEITDEDLKKLTYLDNVVKETFRFFTVVPFTSRSPNKDIRLEGYSIPANKTTYLCLVAASLDPENVRDPFKFDPDRFSTPGSLDGVFMPFSRGPRSCIGKDYALLLMKMMVTHVVRKYELSTDMDIYNLRKQFKVTMRFADGYHVYLNKRKT